jgi:broad specificity phosphatase PhoE
MTHIDLLRHGETVGGNRYRGSIDDALTPPGWAAMRAALGEERGWNRIVSSPLRRCADFARDLAQRHGLPLDIDARLREIHFGDWEGKTASDLLAADPEAVTRFWNDPVNHPPPGAENLLAFQTRVLHAWHEIAAQHAGERLLIVTHGGPIRIILGQVNGLSVLESLRLEVPHAHLSRLESANAPSLARGPRLDPIGESANAPSLARGPRLDPIGESANAPSLARGPRLDPIGEVKVVTEGDDRPAFILLAQSS